MEPIIKLTVSDRFSICRYVNLIPCTLAIRCSIDAFYDKFVPTKEELEKSGAVIENGHIVSIKDNFETEYKYTDVEPSIRNGISDFVESLLENKNAPADYVESVTAPLKKVL